MKSETALQQDSIMTKLKARTAHQHQATEDGVSIMSENFSRKDYENLLVKFYAFYKGYEAKMYKALQKNPIDFDWSNRLNAPRLRKDLSNLGMTEKELDKIKHVEDLPAMDSKAKIFGSLYVIEGSNLGGQVISRHLKEKFGFDETNGAAFFGGNGKETGAIWNKFREAVTAFSTTENEEEIIGAANETFAKIGKALAENSNKA